MQYFLCAVPVVALGPFVLEDEYGIQTDGPDPTALNRVSLASAVDMTVSLTSYHLPHKS